ncbi:peptidoglycan-binding protein [Patescibacteria group bacterium]|nr:peptidoglycan-binding protein [Patescibacteria group bacterium]
MSNLLKSKFLFAVAIVAVMVVGGAFAQTASADCTITPTLRVGSTGASVSCMQAKVGATADGKFGPMTKTAVMAWQAGHGLSADGVVGPMTAAAMNGTASTGGSAALCPNGNTLASNCMTAPAGSTGPLCPNGMTIASNCMSSGTSSGSLTGGAGDVTSFAPTSSGTETTVGEGKTENVLGFDIKADDNSDLSITSAKVVLTLDNNGSTRLERYLDSVSIMQGSNKVGSVDASDFSRTGAVSTATISLSNAVVKAGVKTRFYVAFKALSNIDGDDIDNTIDAELTQVRFNDATGAILTATPDSSVDDTVDFESSSVSDELKLQSSSASPAAANVQVSDTTSTDDVLLGAFKLKAGSDSSDVNVLTIPVDVTITDPASGLSTATADKVLTDLWLQVGSTVYDDSTASSEHDDAINNTSVTTTYTFNIDEGDLEIGSGDTTEIKIYAKLAKTDTNYDEGTILSTFVDGSTLDVENTDGDTVTVSGSSSVTTENQTLRVNGADIEYVSSTSTAANDSNTSRDFTLVFDVTAIGDDITVDRTNVDSSSTTGVQYIVSGTGTVDVNAASLSSTANLNGNIYTVYAGQTKRFTLTVNVGTSATGMEKIVLQKAGGISTTETIESVSATVIQ